MESLRLILLMLERDDFSCLTKEESERARSVVFMSMWLNEQCCEELLSTVSKDNGAKSRTSKRDKVQRKLTKESCRE